MKKVSKAVAIAFAVAGLTAAPMAVAQDDPDTKKPAESQDMQEMMKGMQGNGGMGMMKMMSQMNQMMESCTEMMQAMQSDQEMPGQKDKQPNKG